MCCFDYFDLLLVLCVDSVVTLVFAFHFSLLLTQQFFSCFVNFLVIVIAVCSCLVSRWSVLLSGARVCSVLVFGARAFSVFVLSAHASLMFMPGMVLAIDVCSCLIAPCSGLVFGLAV